MPDFYSFFVLSLFSNCSTVRSFPMFYTDELVDHFKFKPYCLGSCLQNKKKNRNTPTFQLKKPPSESTKANLDRALLLRAWRFSMHFRCSDSPNPTKKQGVKRSPGIPAAANVQLSFHSWKGEALLGRTLKVLPPRHRDPTRPRVWSRGSGGEGSF